MWANAQRDGRPAEYRWHPLFNAAVWLTPNTGVPCTNAAKTRNPLKFAGVPTQLKCALKGTVKNSSITTKNYIKLYYFSKCFKRC